MLVAVNGLGSIWTRRFGRDAGSRTRFTRDAVFYNTTGVAVGDRIRARSRVYGVARFNGCSGFTPHHSERMLNRVFQCAEPCVWNNGNRVVFQKPAAEHARPERYLVIIRNDMAGWIDRESAWCAPDCLLVSFSEADLRQEAMLLMARFSWVRGANGVFVLEPDARKPWDAQLVGEES